MIKPFHFLVVFLPIAGAAARGADIEGAVVDPSGSRISGAEVTCAQARAVTGLDGSFRFPGASSCELRISAQGFETVTMPASPGTPVQVTLPVAGVVERILVTATRGEARMEESGVAAAAFNTSDLRLRQFPFVADFLRELPGSQVVKSGREGSVTSLFTRGAPSNATLFLVDGMPVNDPGGTINLGNWSAEGFQRIEAVRAPQSVLFGAEAAAGAVQLFTMRGDPELRRPRTELSYERGSFQSDRWSASLRGGAAGRFDYALGASQFHTLNEFANDYFRHTGGHVNAGYRLSSATQLRTTFRSFDTAMGVPGQVRYGLFDGDARETNRDALVTARLDDARGANFIQSAFFGYHRSRDVYTDLKMDGPYPVALLVRDVTSPVRRTYREAVLDPRFVPPSLPAGTRVIRTEVTLYPSDEPFVTLNSRKRFEYQGAAGHSGGRLTFGYNFERQDGEISARDVGRNKHGLFFLEQYSVGRRLFLSGGLRAENSSVFGTRVAPRGAASFLLLGEKGVHSSTYLRVSAGRGITEPSLLQNFARDAWFQGNPNLKPERTHSFETGLVQEWLGRKLRTEVSAFWNSFHDLIVFVSLPPPVWGSWDNVDKSWARGVEFSGRARVAKNLTLNGVYTRMYTRIVNSNSPASPTLGIGQELMRRPRNSGSVFLSLTPRRWWLTAGAALVGERQDTDFLGVTRNSAYQNVYAAGGWRLNRHVTPFLRCDNLLNSRYEEALGYSSLSRAVRGGLKLAW